MNFEAIKGKHKCMSMGCSLWLDSCLNDSDDDSEEAESAAEDFDNEDLDEGGRSLGISKGASRTSHTNAHTAE